MMRTVALTPEDEQAWVMAHPNAYSVAHPRGGFNYWMDDTTLTMCVCLEYSHIVGRMKVQSHLTKCYEAGILAYLRIGMDVIIRQSRDYV